MAYINEYPTEAKYNIKEVSQQTDIQSVTIRAWERRYQLLDPQRGTNGYRLYSQRDIATLDWVKRQVETGRSISAVAVELRTAIEKEKWPEAVLSGKGPVPSKSTSELDAPTLARQLVTSLTRIDERMSSDIFSDALGMGNLLQLFESILIPVLVEIGLRWERGEIKVVVEHFASQLIQGKIRGIYHSLPFHPSAAKIIVGCAPDELHEIGPLMFATLLRNTGYRVEYLGPDIPLDDLAFYVSEEKPRMVVISATILDSAMQLVNFSNLLDRVKPIPIFGFAGAAFTKQPDFITKITGLYLGRSLTESLANVKTLIPLRPNAG